MADKLSAQQELFVLNVAKGLNQTQAYVAAGYKARGPTAEANSSRLLRNAKVAARLKELAQEIKDESIADAKERHRFWTTVMRDAEADMKDRLKGSELLGKAQGDFKEQLELSGTQDITITRRIVGNLNES